MSDQKSPKTIDKHGLLSAPIIPTLQKMTLPMTFGMIAILMFNLVDTFFISLLGTDSLAAVSFTFPITFGINCINMGVGTGIAANIARLLGQQNHQRAATFTSHGLLLALLLITITSLIGFNTLTPLFTHLGASQHLLPLINQYMQIWYLAVPLLAIPMAANSAIRATGDTKTPAKILMLSGLINGLLDPLLIFGIGPFPELGVQGAAIASGCSWLGASIAALYILFVREKQIAKPQLKRLLEDWKNILKIGTPAGCSTAMNPLSGAIYMMLLASYGSAAIAAYGTAQRVESILLLVILSLSSALTPFIAQNLAANQPQRAFRGLFLSMRFSIIFQCGIFIALVPLSYSIAALFSQDSAVKMQLWQYLLIVPFSYGFQGVVMILISSLNAMHRSLHAFAWSFTRLFICTLPSAYIGSYLYGVEGMFIGIAIGNITCGIAAYLFAKRTRTLYVSEQSDNEENHHA